MGWLPPDWAIPKRHCVFSARRRPLIFLPNGRGPPAAFILLPRAESGCCRYLASLDSRYAATAYLSIRIFPPDGTVLPSAFSGVVGASSSASIGLNDVSLHRS